MSPQIESCNSPGYRDLQIWDGSLAHHLPTDNRPMPSELSLVVENWLNLSEAVRAGIVAMVKASSRPPEESPNG